MKQSEPNKRTTVGLFSYRTLLLGTLTVIFTFNFVDRLVFSILQENIKADLGLSDLQIGMVSGLAFALFFSVMGLPIAWAADRFNRVNIITASLAIWSLFTAACGVSVNFWQLFLARVGVGFGEAGCTPPAHSMISDHYQPKERGRALAIYTLGLPVGALLGLLAGGWMVQHFSWQLAFIIIGLPGILVAIIGRLIMREPKRGALDEVPARALSFSEIAEVLRNNPTFWWITLGSSCLAFGGYSLNAWMIPHFERTYELSKLNVATIFGLVGLVPTVIGTYAGGWIADRLAIRDVRWYAWVPMIAAGIMGPTFFLALQMPSLQGLLLVWLLPAFMAGIWFAPVAAIAQNIFPAGMRAMAVAINTFAGNIIGLGLGPMLTGGLSTYFTLPDGSNEAEALKLALSIIVWIYLLGCLLYFLGARKLHTSWLPGEK